MSAFTGPLDLRHLDLDWRRWELLSPLVYEVGELGSGRRIEVPAGFITDGASVPQLLWGALPPWGSYSRAAAVHDFLLVRLKARNPHPEAPTRDAADLIFREAVRVCGTPWPIRAVLYAGVRLGTLAARLRA